MTSFISPPRSDFARCSPSTHEMASETFDLPQPFGPTTAVIPLPVKTISVWSAKDLKPVISRRWSLNIYIVLGRTRTALYFVVVVFGSQTKCGVQRTFALAQ